MNQRPDSPIEEKAALEAIIAADEEHFSGALTDANPIGPAALHSTIWTVAGFAVMHALRFAFNIPATRLVEPEVFGVMALVSLFIQGVHQFSDLGLRQCVINSTRGNERQFLDTAWTIQVIRGFFLWLITAAIAWPLGQYYGVNALYWLLPIVGFSAVLDGFTATASMTMSRDLQRGKLVIREIAAYVTSMAMVIAWLVLLKIRAGQGKPDQGSQMIAYAVGSIVSNAIEMALSYTLIRGAVNWFAWDWSAVRELSHFGGWIFVSTACTFLAANFDRLFVGKVGEHSLVTLANYQIAAMIVRTPTMLAAAVGHQVIFPLYSRIREASGSLKATFPLIHSAMNGTVAYVVAGTIASGPTLIRLVYDERYEPASTFVLGLGIAAWFTVLQTSSEVVLLALGKTRQVATGQFIKMILLLPLLAAGYFRYGVFGVIYGYAIAEAARYVVLSASVAREKMPVLRLDLMLSALVVISVLLTQLISPHLQVGGGKLAQFGFRLIGEIAFMTAFWASVLALWCPRHGWQLVALLWQKQ